MRGSHLAKWTGVDTSGQLLTRVLHLRHDQTLFGLYEGVPLSARQGEVRVLPDKITLFKNPLCASVNTMAELREQIRHTLWHEIAHYYGLDHARIHELDGL